MYTGLWRCVGCGVIYDVTVTPSLPLIYKSVNAQIFSHYKSANKLRRKRNIDRFIENRNNGLRNRKLDFT